jgi:unsaturated chondroitin disaccharide hydrolase
LEFVQYLTDAYLKRLPAYYIPYWDFDDPSIPNGPREAVVASGLLELSTCLNNAKGENYKQAAIKTLQSLIFTAYQSGKAKPSFLLHSTCRWPNHSEVDVSIIYADYYIETLFRFRSRLDFYTDYNFAPNGALKDIIHEQFYHNSASPKLDKCSFRSNIMVELFVYRNKKLHR